MLVLGNGAREHSLAWKIKNSRSCSKIYLHPGNAGTQQAGFESLPLEAHTADSISRHSKERGVELVVIGPEALLAQGYADTLRRDGFLVVGPDRFASQLETSKVFAKQFMERHGVPTPAFKVASNLDELDRFLPARFPVVLKLDGLAAGKGVVISNNRSEALDFAKRVFNHHEFGQGSHRIIVEDFLQGPEVSYIGFCDGDSFIPCETATDYKRVMDANKGPNTGGMGAVSPSPYFNAALKEKIDRLIVGPVLKGLKEDSIEYRGILYIGILVTSNGSPFVLEFNTRFGDPETQAVLLRMESDLVPLLLSTAKGTLKSAPTPHWTPKTSVYVVAAAEGYPFSARYGDIIGGLETLSKGSNVFFSGVSQKENFLVTSGGRVLGLGVLGDDAQSARTQAYAELRRIHWRGMHYRSDIGLADMPSNET